MKLISCKGFELTHNSLLMRKCFINDCNYLYQWTTHLIFHLQVFQDFFFTFSSLLHVICQIIKVNENFSLYLGIQTSFHCLYFLLKCNINLCWKMINYVLQNSQLVLETWQDNAMSRISSYHIPPSHHSTTTVSITVLQIYDCLQNLSAWFRW